MLKFISSLVALMILSSVGLAAEQSAKDADQGYVVIKPARPTQDPSKVEVIEFFSYGCIHCYTFEPSLKVWLKTLPANVHFIRQPAVFQAPWKAYAKAYFTAESLGVLDKVHDAIYDAIHNEKKPLQSEEDLANFFVAHGVKSEDFTKAYKSFSVDAKLRQAEVSAPAYGIEGTPSLVVNGKYRIKAAAPEKMFEVANRLIAEESKAK